MGNCLWRDLASTMICACLFKKPRVGTSSSSSVSEAASAADVLLSTGAVVTSTDSLRRPGCKHSTCHCYSVRNTRALAVGVVPWRASPFTVPGYVVSKATLEHVFSQYFGFPLSIVAPMLHTHSFIRHHQYVILINTHCSWCDDALRDPKYYNSLILVCMCVHQRLMLAAVLLLCHYVL